ncbi:hypothetical protein AU197_12820 [Mycobacterium sp. IS-1590]|uniref:hypothetical protein n=1 Tax=Mycobacterium sp. IS-1590 TaxID=1772286 RepID=UPI000746330B|nr:hypothetical protein [Mycobacterium sp. IS-1590]KUI45121.1 hypothetical protein AU197_12820 [Mycobacterium sp. IS-1590]
MGETFDASARLADGGPGVDDVAQYVLACQSLGYRHPDLTAHPGQVHDWYAAEAGLDLGALESDCAALQVAATAVEDALVRQEAQLAALTSSWQGIGANASREFLRRHDEAATVAATAARSAASALTELRERLWRAVDDKVATVVGIADGVQARREDWLAAAHTVTTGAGDRAVASELVDHEVKPFVDTVIGGEWVAAMREATDSINAAYEAATAQLASEAAATFDIPGDLGPAWPPSSAAGVAETPVAGVPATSAAGAAANPVAPSPVPPAGWGASAALPVAPPPFAPPAVTPLPTEAPVPQSAAAPSLPSLGGGLPDFGGGLTSFGQQLGDMLGGLLGDGALDAAVDDDERNGLPTPDPDELDDGETTETQETSGATGAGEEGEDEAAEPDDATDPAVAETMCQPEPPPDSEPAPPEEPPATVPPEPPTVPPGASAVPPEPLAVPPQPSEAGTPCEIAADELPQVGE